MQSQEIIDSSMPIENIKSRDKLTTEGSQDQLKIQKLQN